MLGLRQTLGLAFGGLLTVLFVVGMTSIFLVNRYSSTLETMFRENYDTVLYSEGMKDALADLDALAGRGPAGLVPTDERDSAVRRFEDNLQREVRNITLPGEGEAVGRLQQQWDAYKADFQRFLDSELGDRPAFYHDRLTSSGEAVRTTVQHIIDMNLANMVSVDGQARAEAVAARNSMIALMVVGASLALALTAVLGRAVLRPVQTLTASVREIERGNLDLEVPVTSSDELGQLAEAFNAMAARLRQFRASDRARLQRSERTTQIAVNTFPDAVAVIGVDGRVELANETAARLFDLRAGKAVTESPDPAVGRIVAETLASRRSFEPTGYRDAIERFDGEKRYFQPRAVPIEGEDGALIGITLVLSDVTNLRRLDEMKSGLVSTVSHELKTPLTSIRMAAHLLLEGRVGPLTDKQTELLTAAREDSDRLHSIIDNLLDMGRIEAGRYGIDLQAVGVARLLDSAAQAHAALFRDKGVALDVDAPPGLPPVLADEDRLRHVFANLLDNALTYSAPGGHVAIRARRREEMVEISVTDDGAGIAPEHLPRVFDRFYRAGQPRTRAGAGLGLAIVREIVEAHGGSVGVESREGAGSTFRFTLRVAPDTTPTDSPTL